MEKPDSANAKTRRLERGLQIYRGRKGDATYDASDVVRSKRTLRIRQVTGLN